MVQAHAQSSIDRPAEAIFHYIATRFFENYPRWSPEVCELQPLTPGPVRLGTKARQVRVDQSRRSESTFQVTAYEPAQRLVFTSTSLQAPLSSKLPLRAGARANPPSLCL